MRLTEEWFPIKQLGNLLKGFPFFQRSHIRAFWLSE